MFVGSDAIALAPMTNRITYLEEGDCAVVSRNSVEIYDEAGHQTNRAMKTIQIDATRIEKGGYKHFMAKEIAEQPGVLGSAITHYVGTRGNTISLPGTLIDFTTVDRVILVACGTAYYACLTAKYWLEQVARIPAEVDIASEFRYREPPISGNTVAIFVSQSGETADTLAALRYCKGKAGQIVSVVNVPESSIARESDVALPIHAGVEVGVASTKAFTCQLNVLLTLSLHAAAARGHLTGETLSDAIGGLRNLPGLLNHALGLSDELKRAAKQLSKAHDVLYLGRGAMFPLALEGALKLKEISYIHAEGYASGELKHGPIALIDKEVPVVVMAPSDALFEKAVSNMQEVMARDGKVLLITDAKGAKSAGQDVWKTIIMPEAPELICPLLYSVPAQLLAYYAAVAKGTDVDQPRNLAKSVTVE
jgi:glucosamine--fructose-6-phosphate aminotransferase (isomerizing)